MLFVGVLFAAGEVVEELENDHAMLCKLVHIQRMDTEFSSLDLNDFIAVTDYFYSVISCSEDEVMTEALNHMIIVTSALTGEKREECHAVLREAVEKVHRILINSKGQNPLITAFEVVDCLTQAFRSAADIVVLFHDNEHVRMIKTRVEGMTSKDIAPKGGEEYEVVG